MSSVRAGGDDADGVRRQQAGAVRVPGMRVERSAGVRPSCGRCCARCRRIGLAPVAWWLLRCVRNAKEHTSQAEALHADPGGWAGEEEEEEVVALATASNPPTP